MGSLARGADADHSTRRAYSHLSGHPSSPRRERMTPLYRAYSMQSRLRGDRRAKRNGAE